MFSRELPFYTAEFGKLVRACTLLDWSAVTEGEQGRGGLCVCVEDWTWVGEIML